MFVASSLRSSTASVRRHILSSFRPYCQQSLRFPTRQFGLNTLPLGSSGSAWNNPKIFQQNKVRNFMNSTTRYAANSTHSAYHNSQRAKNMDSLMYTTSLLIVVLGCSYAAVPLYRMFCATTGYGGTPNTNHTFEAENLVPVTNSRRLKITFSSNVSDMLEWSFKPQQREVNVLPGETALAFYTAKNKADKDIIGISTYNVTPMKAGQYFNKIQCFCFEEQKLTAGEEVDMPVFFFIDPEFAEDPWMEDVDTITLSYTFFNARPNPGAKPQ
ncbi:Cytochrome c oxidase assembly protein cox11, mitochondrial [Basidiobolus ranarum]|uniref:Cytochrome c oxidase assembly protein cox11, mitochondrial n=1 Tax=Basidiobolus ranarum TaxID=34480 RepID=A0ABR2VNG4_9FUNG